MLTVDKHCCDEFPVPQIDRQSKQVRTVTWKILFTISVGEKLAILNTENIEICG